MTLYLVKFVPTDPTTRLVEAKTKSQAIAHVIDGCVSAAVPGPRELLELGQKNMAVETAGATKGPERIVRAAE